LQLVSAEESAKARREVATRRNVARRRAKGGAS
jgi:hypothetical protein